jgi:hypothetical protein
MRRMGAVAAVVAKEPTDPGPPDGDGEEGGGDAERGRAPAGETAPDEGEPGAIVCRVCEARITEEAYRIAVQERHEHTFVNPGGFDYRIGCFALAPGCVEIGSPETYFSWFPGHSWQIVACASCRQHLGWRFRCAGESFHGLILDRLVSRA